MKRYVNPRGTLIFVLIAVAFMLVLHFMFDLRPAVPDAEELSQAPQDPPYFYTDLQYPQTFEEPTEADIGNEALEEIIAAYTLPEAKQVIELGKSVEPAKPKAKTAKKKAPAYEKLVVQGSPQIALIIDDMGVDRRRSQKVIDIDAPLTLAFLPYAESLDDITARAQSKGHELMIHMPMQATTNPVSLGPIAVKVGMDEAEVKSNVQAAFESFAGYVGLNNHMGSKATQDPDLMNWVMEKLKERDLYFIDSKTIGSSVAADVARQNGLDTAVRDVFLDHEDTPEFVAGALRKLEKIAAREGHAIAIGHPKDATINGLLSWIPDAQARGFKIVHASALLEKPVGAVASAKPVAARTAAVKVKTPAAPLKAVEATQPAAGDEEASPPKPIASIEAEAKNPLEDPNSAQAREAILKKLLGQSLENSDY